MKLETQSFGTLEYDERAVLDIQEGMLGFSQHKRYLLIENEDIQPFKLLQSIDDRYVAFPVIDPRIVVNDYALGISQEDIRSLGIELDSDIVTLVVVIIPEDPVRTTVNFKAPLLINHRRMIGKQIILTESHYHTMQPLVLPLVSGQIESPVSVAL